MNPTKERLRIALCTTTVLMIAACASIDEATKAISVERVGMVVTANPHATQAGVDILKAGGSAVDAAVAIKAVLGLVEPQSSSLAGSGFLVHYDAQTRELSVYNGREKAPESVTSSLFLDEEGQPREFLDAKVSGLSTGVPGITPMLAMAHDDHGALPWGGLFDHGKALATNGFAVSPRLNGMMELMKDIVPMRREDGPLDARNYLYAADGEPLPVGFRLTNPAYGETLNALSADAYALHKGELAQRIVDTVALSPKPGAMTLEDLASYRPVKTGAICTDYRDMKVCGAPAPSSFVAVAQILGLVEASGGFDTPDATDWRNWDRFVQAQRLAYADRDQFVADPDKVGVPTAGLIHPSYLEERARLITVGQPRAQVVAGNPYAYPASPDANFGADTTLDVRSTTHFVVVDQDGDVVSMTASVESIFGSTRMVGGMFLNNQLTDFAIDPKDAKGRLVANAPDGGKRPRSSMSPTIILDSDRNFKLATGSPGGSSIIAYVAKSIFGVLDWNMSAQDSIALSNVVARGDTVRLEKDRAPASLTTALRNVGHTTDNTSGENSGLSMVVRRADGTLEGGVDPRREGVVQRVTLD